VKPQQQKELIKSITERGWVLDGDVYRTPTEAAALGLNNKPLKKSRSKVFKTGWLDDSRNIKNRETIHDTFRMLIKKEFDADLVWPEFIFSVDRNYRLDYTIPVLEDGKEVKIALEVHGGIYAKGNSGHTSAKGLLRDFDKSNLLQSLGWRLITVTPDQLLTVKTIETIKIFMGMSI